MNIQTPTLTATNAMQLALQASPVDLARQESGKQLVLNEDEIKYLQLVKGQFKNETIISLPLEGNFLSQSNMTKDKVIDLWHRLNKSTPDDKYTKIMKQVKKKRLTEFKKLPLSFTKFGKLSRFLVEAPKTTPSPEKPVQSRVVPIDPNQRRTKIKIPQLVAWETEENRQSIYPLLDQFIDSIDPQEFVASTTAKASPKGWSLWTTAEEGVAVATLCVKSQRIAQTMAQGLIAHKIKAKVSQERDSINTHLTVCIRYDSRPDLQEMKKANTALVNEYKRLLSEGERVSEAEKKLSHLSL